MFTDIWIRWGNLIRNVEVFTDIWWYICVKVYKTITAGSFEGNGIIGSVTVFQNDELQLFRKVVERLV